MSDLSPHIVRICAALRSAATVRDVGVAVTAFLQVWGYLKFELRADHGLGIPQAGGVDEVLVDALTAALAGDDVRLFDVARHLADHEAAMIGVCEKHKGVMS